MLSKEIDNYVNYNVKSDKLINYISSLNPLYNTYSNKYTKINNKDLLDYLKDGISLSYSSLDNYYKCSFKYYIKHILKLDTFEDSFDTFIGKLFHYVIENGLLNDKDSNILIDEYLKDKELSKKEKVFINNLKEDIEFMLSALRDNLKYTNLKDVIFEQNIKVYKNDKIKVTFTGFIDAMMYKKYSDKTICIIIDYKTGNVSSDLAYLPYGLSMQLPIYLYLAKNSEIKDITFGGFYLQKVLPEKHKIDLKKTEEDKKREDLRLHGYSNSDLNILKEVDNSYEDSKLISGLKMTKTGTFYAYSKLLSSDDINKIIDITDKNIDKAIDNISLGNFDINPKVTDKENLGCAFCEFKDICFKTNDDNVKIVKDKELSFLGGDINA